MATSPLVFKATPAFRKMFDDLSAEQQRAAREAFKKFKVNPFDPALKAHKIHRLSARLKKTVRAVEILPDLRMVFIIEGNVVTSFGIGSHDIYK